MLRVRTVMQTTGSGGPYLNTLYFLGDTLTNAQDANTAVGTFWGAVDAIMANNITWSTDSEVAIVDPVTGNVTGFHAVTPVTGAGARTLEQLPFATQALIRWRTSAVINGRRLQGRTFVPGLTEEANDDGRLIAADQATLLSAANALISAASADLGIWSETNQVVHNVVSASVWAQFAQLRRRRD